MGRGREVGDGDRTRQERDVREGGEMFEEMLGWWCVSGRVAHQVEVEVEAEAAVGGNH